MRLPIVLTLIALAAIGGGSFGARAQAPDPAEQAQAAVAGQLASALSASQGQVARLQAQVAGLQAELKAAHAVKPDGSSVTAPPAPAQAKP